jgi:hypothetical protein
VSAAADRDELRSEEHDTSDMVTRAEMRAEVERHKTHFIRTDEGLIHAGTRAELEAEGFEVPED